MKNVWNNVKKYCLGHEWLVVLLFFLMNFILRGLLSQFSKSIAIYNDELYYYGLAKSFYHGWGMIVRGVPVYFQKILYSLCIAPTFAIQSSTARMSAIAWINALAISMSAFPAYGIAKKLFQQTKYIYICLIYWFTMSTMISPVYIMCESFFMPLSLLFVYLVIVAFQDECQDLCDRNGCKNWMIRQAILHVGIGLLLNALFQVQASSLYLLAAYLLVRFLQIIKLLYDRKCRDKVKRMVCYLLQMLILVVVFLGIYSMIKYAFFAGSDSSYLVDAANTNRIGDRMKSLFTYFPYNFVYMILAFGVIPVLMPSGIIHKVSGKEKKLYLFLIFSMIAACGAVSSLITMSEDVGLNTIRQHIRYIEPLTYASWCLFIHFLHKHRDAYDEKAWKITAISHAIYCALFVMIASNFNGEIPMDQSCLKVYHFITQNLMELTENFGQGTLMPLLFRVVLSLGIAGVLYLIYKKKKHIISYIILGSMCLNIGNYVVAYVEAYDTYYVNEEFVGRFDKMDEYLSELDGNILVIVNIKKGATQPFIDTYIDTPVSIVTLRDLFDSGIIEDGVIELEKEKIPATRPEKKYYGVLSQVDYVLTWGDISIGHVNPLSDLPTESDGYILYENLEKDKIYVNCTYEDVVKGDEFSQIEQWVIEVPPFDTIQE